MKQHKMFLSQRRMNEVIVYCILVDIVLGFILKKLQANNMGPVIILYALNLFVIAGVYRFWKAPLFEWGDTGFIFYGISPFKKNIGVWRDVEKAGFKLVEGRKGRTREYLIIIYLDKRGRTVTGAVPMDMVGFADRIKADMQEFIKGRRIKPL